MPGFIIFSVLHLTDYLEMESLGNPKPSLCWYKHTVLPSKRRCCFILGSLWPRNTDLDFSYSLTQRHNSLMMSFIVTGQIKLLLKSICRNIRWWAIAKQGSLIHRPQMLSDSTLGSSVAYKLSFCSYIPRDWSDCCKILGHVRGQQ